MSWPKMPIFAIPWNQIQLSWPEYQQRAQRHPVMVTLGACVLAVVTAVVAVLLGANMNGVSDKNFLEGIRNENGIIFLGHIFQIDIKARAVGVSWLIGGCGTYKHPDAKIFPGSADCGPPNIPLNVYVDGSLNATYSYDPTLHPREDGSQTIVYVQSLNEFQTTMLMEIHSQSLKLAGSIRLFDQQYLYPFDIYSVRTALRVVNSDDNSTIPIIRATFADYVNNFTPTSTSRPSQNRINGITFESRIVELLLQRTSLAKAFTMILFVVNWALTAMVVGITVVALVGKSKKIGEGILILPVTTILTLPALRALYVESPSFGILLDVCGLFLQMIIVSGCSIILLIGISLYTPLHVETQMADTKVGHYEQVFDQDQGNAAEP